MGLFIHFYIIFGTNLLTQGPVQIAVFFAYFSVSQKRNIKWNETFGRVIFGTNVIQRTWSGRQETYEVAMRQGVRLPRWARPPPLWPPRGSSELISKSLGVFWSKNNHHEGFIPFGIPFL